MRAHLTRLACVVLALASTVSPMPARAGFKTGNDLLRECEAGEGRGSSMLMWGTCAGYVIGAADAIGFWTAVENGESCIPASSQAGQLKDIVVKYLRDHPETRHFEAYALVYVALGQAFNCKLLSVTPRKQ
jgi:hypothetical protein